MKNRIRGIAERGRKYWTDHNVTVHKVFQSQEESLDYFHWRNCQYVGYIELMPVSAHDDEVIVDFGCGPGNDLVGFGLYSNPKRLYGMDVSPTSLEEARRRLALHNIRCDLIELEAGETKIPLESESVDYIHCSGVLMAVPSPKETLLEFYRILKPRGTLKLMVYNYDSIWLHLYVAHILMFSDPKYADLDFDEAFNRSTDGFECPINRKWRVPEMIALGEACGFGVRHLGNAIALFEMSLLPQRFNALMNPAFRPESRRVLSQLTFDHRGVPYFEGEVAGIDGCYELKK